MGGGGGKKLQQLVASVLHLHHHPSSSSAAAQQANSKSGGGVVRRGHLAVYVGEARARARFVVPTAYLKQASFVALLESAEEDYFGLDHHCHPAGLAIPSCSEQDFATLVRTLG